jgi:hypothetical protein
MSIQSKNRAIKNVITLVRSLTKAQKRDFKKYVKFWGEASGRERKYITIFDEIQRCITMSKDDDTIVNHLLRLDLKDLNNTAQYLYNKVLESMRTTPDISPYLNQLNGMMQDLVFLYNKNLFENCREIVAKALPLARALDKPALELEWNFWEFRLRGWTNDNFTEKSLNEWVAAQEQSIARAQQEVQLDRLQTIVRRYFHYKQHLPESIEEEVSNYILYEESDVLWIESLGIRSKILLYSILSDYYDLKYMMHGSKTAGSLVKKALLDKAIHYQGRIIELYRTDKIIEEEEQVSFLAIMDNYVNRCLRNGRVDLTERLESDWEKSKNELVKIRNLASYRLSRHLTLNEFRQAREYLEKNNVLEGLEKYEMRIPTSRYQVIVYSAGQVYYAQDDFEKAVDFFQKVIDIKTELRPEIVLVCKILEIICLWEYGAYKNDPDIQRPVRNLRRSLSRSGQLSDFVGKTLDGVEMVFRSSRALTKAGFPDLLNDLKTEYAQRKGDKNIIMFFLVLAWFDARLNRTSIGVEILKYS